MVKVYSTLSCPYCFALKNFLRERDIVFEDIDITENEREKEKIIKKTGKMEVPAMEINGEIIVGFDKEKISKLLDIN